MFKKSLVAFLVLGAVASLNAGVSLSKDKLQIVRKAQSLLNRRKSECTKASRRKEFIRVLDGLFPNFPASMMDTGDFTKPMAKKDPNEKTLSEDKDNSRIVMNHKASVLSARIRDIKSHLTASSKDDFISALNNMISTLESFDPSSITE